MSGATPGRVSRRWCCSTAGSGSWTHWVRNIQPLVAAGRQVIAADLPGFGDSASPPSGGDADALVAPLAEGLERLAWRRAL
jgi:2-hydroxy-6-oxonona-2,4-dienedioate hydrolase